MRCVAAYQILNLDDLITPVPATVNERVESATTAENHRQPEKVVADEPHEEGRGSSVRDDDEAPQIEVERDDDIPPRPSTIAKSTAISKASIASKSVDPRLPSKRASQAASASAGESGTNSRKAAPERVAELRRKHAANGREGNRSIAPTSFYKDKDLSTSKNSNTPTNSLVHAASTHSNTNEKTSLARTPAPSSTTSSAPMNRINVDSNDVPKDASGPVTGTLPRNPGKESTNRRVKSVSSSRSVKAKAKKASAIQNAPLSQNVIAENRELLSAKKKSRQDGAPKEQDGRNSSQRKKPNASKRTPAPTIRKKSTVPPSSSRQLRSATKLCRGARHRG